MGAITATACPCGSGHLYTDCCQPLHWGVATNSAEALMRSRYSAYALGLSDYILQTWHPSTRPETFIHDPTLRWLRLKVLNSTQRDGEHATVEFIATYKPGGLRAEKLHEISRFERLDRWYYLDGVHP